MNENIARNHRNALDNIEHATITQESRQVAKALNTREDTSLTTEPTPATATDGDSAYASLARSGTSIVTETPAESTNRTQQRGRRVRGTDLLVFKKEVDKKRLEHYDNVRSAIEELLTEKIDADGRDPYCSMVTRLLVMGKSEQEAILRLVIFCEPKVKKTVLNFFESPHIIALLHPSRFNFPRLGYLVIPEAPRMRSALHDITVYCNNVSVTKHPTHCGASIMLKSGSGSNCKRDRRYATFGGMIKVIHEPGRSKLYGLTAGHLVEDLLGQEHMNELESCEHKSEPYRSCGVAGWTCEHNLVGQVVDPEKLPGVAARGVKRTHDWALIDVDEPRPNEVVGVASRHDRNHDKNKNTASDDDTLAGNDNTQQILAATHPTFQDNISDPALLLSGTHGTQRGEISCLPASIWLSHTGGFVKAYMLELEDGNGKSCIFFRT
jgi:hypothetical protein